MDHNVPTASTVGSADRPLRTVVSGFGAVGKSLEGIGAWQILLTLLVLSITYDQRNHPHTYTTHSRTLYIRKYSHRHTHSLPLSAKLRIVMCQAVTDYLFFWGVFS